MRTINTDLLGKLVIRLADKINGKNEQLMKVRGISPAPATADFEAFELLLEEMDGTLTTALVSSEIGDKIRVVQYPLTVLKIWTKTKKGVPYKAKRQLEKFLFDNGIKYMKYIKDTPCYMIALPSSTGDWAFISETYMYLTSEQIWRNE